MDSQPSEVVTGLRRAFSFPAVYRLAQRGIGAERLRKVLVNDVLDLSEGDRVLDVGCGPADILDHLPEVDYVGFDHSESYIAAAQNRYGDRGRFIKAGSDSLDSEDIAARDLAMSIGVLHHLNDEEAAAALTVAHNALRPGGRFVSIDPTVVDGQHPIARFLASRDRGQHVRTPDQTLELVAQTFDEVDVTARHDLLHVPYSHVLVEARRS